MADHSLRYRIPGAQWHLEFSAAALNELRKHVQRKFWQREAVGQLFCPDLTSDIVYVHTVTRLRSHWASYSGVRFNAGEAQAERDAFFKLGLHCIGLWHSHPERIPIPSSQDRELAAEHARAARPILAGLVFVIVGQAPLPQGLGVWVHDGDTVWQAEPVTI